MSRSYSFNGVEYPSVTTCLGILDKPALIAWAANTAVNYCEQHATEPDVFEKAKKEWREAAAEAMDIGSEIHNLIEKYIKNGKDAVGELRPEVENGFLAFLDWEKSVGAIWIESEKNVYSEDYGFAGTLDAIVKFTKGKLAGRTFTIDFKSSKGFYDEYAYQIAGYDYARLECNGKTAQVISYDGTEYTVEYPSVETDGVGILRLDKATGVPEFKDYTKNNEKNLRTFKAVVDLYYKMKKRRLKNNHIIKEIWG